MSKSARSSSKKQIRTPLQPTKRPPPLQPTKRSAPRRSTSSAHAVTGAHDAINFANRVIALRDQHPLLGAAIIEVIVRRPRGALTNAGALRRWVVRRAAELQLEAGGAA